MRVFRITGLHHGKAGGFLAALRGLQCETTMNKVSKAWLIHVPQEDSLIDDLVDRIRTSGAEVDEFTLAE